MLNVDILFDFVFRSPKPAILARSWTTLMDVGTGIGTALRPAVSGTIRSVLSLAPVGAQRRQQLLELRYHRNLLTAL